MDSEPCFKEGLGRLLLRRKDFVNKDGQFQNWYSAGEPWEKEME